MSAENLKYNPVHYRLIKIAANSVKFILLAYTYLFPEARKSIPNSLPAKRLMRREKQIPRIVWQTNYTDRVTWPVYANFLFNRFMTPEFEYRYHNDEQCAAFIAEHFPGTYLEAFQQLQVGAAKADFWRILVLLHYGGIYLDIDSNFCVRPEEVIADDDDVLFLSMDNGEITNYCLAAAPGHPALRTIADRIAKNIQTGEINSVYDMTGPTVVDEVAKQFELPTTNYRNLCVQGQFVNKQAQYFRSSVRRWQEEQKLRSIVKR